jgi:hypothetical protein
MLADFFSNWDISRGFLYILFTGRNSEAAMGLGGAVDIILIKRIKHKKLGRMFTPVYTLILTPNKSKKAWPLRKTPQNDGYVYIINMHICNTTNN